MTVLVSEEARTERQWQQICLAQFHFWILNMTIGNYNRVRYFSLPFLILNNGFVSRAKDWTVQEKEAGKGWLSH